MRASIVLWGCVASGCSLIVPGTDGLTPDLVDSGQTSAPDAGRDAGPEEVDAGTDAGTDAGPPCEAGLTLCGGDCVDLQSDLAHCGECGNACAATDVCREGACFDPAVEVAAGPEHTCVRRGSGQVWCWGSNIRGQLGDGTVVDSTVPVRVVDIDDAVQISVSGFTFSEPEGVSCALSADGSVRCWGTNSSGELGDGTMDPRSRPVPVDGLRAAAQISAGYSRSCARTTDRRIFCWGSDGRGDSMPPTEMSAGGAVGAWVQSMDAINGVACASRVLTGSVYCHSSTDDLQLHPVPGVADAVEVSVGVGRCALLSSGRVTCWGPGNFIGVGLTTTEEEPPTTLALEDVVAIDGGGATCAIHGPERNVSCWGVDFVASVETGSSTVAPLPVVIEGLHDVRDVSAGSGSACAVREDGTVLCWGNNSYGQLGTGDLEPRLEPTVVALP